MSQPTRHMSLKMRWMIWRARMSTPAMLSRSDERKVISLVAAVNGGLAILTIGLFAWLTDLPLVFPALGPSTFILFTMPLSPGGAPRSVILGHWTCLGCGYTVWHLMGLAAGEPVSLQTGGWPLFVSPTLTLGLSCLFMVRLSCPHPPACASGLVVAIGAVTQVHELLLMAVVIVWLTYQAVGMNRFAGLPVPIWSPRRLGE